MDFHQWKSAHATTGVIGVSDCCLALADWAVANGYDDAVAEYRGTYSNDEEMYRLIASHGDVVGMVGFGAEKTGIPVASRRSYGCIAVIGNKSNMYRQWGAIWDGASWQVRLKQGFIALHAPAIKMWKI